MGDRRRVWPVWALCALTTGVAVASFGANLLGRDGAGGVVQLAGEALLAVALPVAFAVVAALIVARQPRNTIGWLLLVPVGLAVVAAPLQAYLHRLAPTPPTPTPPLLLPVRCLGWSWLLLIFPLLHIALLCPSGRPPTPRWRWVGVAARAWAAHFVLLVTFSPPLRANTTPDVVLDIPLAVLGEGTAGRLSVVCAIGVVALVVLCVAALVARYRRAGRTERAQLKWLLYACGVFLAVYLPGTAGRLSDSSSPIGAAWRVAFGLSLVAIPAAIGVAILRYRLYDIELIIRRTLIYGALTATLAAVYVGGVALLTLLLRPLPGRNNQLAIVASTLAIFALPQPLRRRIQAAIDRRLYRRTYDAQRTLAAFGARLRDETDLGRIQADLLATVQETMQPAHAALWLRPVERRGTRGQPAADEGG
jgi:hypothetical protein